MDSQLIRSTVRNSLRGALLAGATALTVAAASGVAQADLVFTGSGTATDTTAIAASADFSLSGNILTITLTNTASVGTTSGASVLTNLGFDPVPSPNSTLPSSAGTITASNIVMDGSQSTSPAVDNLGGNWAYLTSGGNAGYPGGLASSGWGIGTNDGNLCGTSTTCTSTALDGPAYGIVSSATKTARSALKNDNLVQNSVTATITINDPGFTLADITNVIFEYGTGVNDGTTLEGKRVPEPGSLALLGTGLIGLGLAIRRGRRRA